MTRRARNELLCRARIAHFIRSLPTRSQRSKRRFSPCRLLLLKRAAQRHSASRWRELVCKAFLLAGGSHPNLPRLLHSWFWPNPCPALERDLGIPRYNATREPSALVRRRLYHCPGARMQKLCVNVFLCTGGCPTVCVRLLISQRLLCGNVGVKPP